jgi:hypothetical protein
VNEAGLAPAFFVGAKCFFFEKKKQKTFDSAGALPVVPP